MTDTMEMQRRALPPPSAGPQPAPRFFQVSQAPTLPMVVAPVPRPANVASPFASAMTPAAPSSASNSTHRGGVRRTVSWMLVLAVLGGIGYAGFRYGPELIEQVGAAKPIGEPDAPLVYPPVSAAPSPVRTATFSVEAAGQSGTERWEATVDFDTGVSRVVLSRPDSVDLEVLTLYDQAVIRRVDDPQWYTLPRGDFPIDTTLGRSRWVRTIDELVPAGIRQYTTIKDASESSIGAFAARRLLITADPEQMRQATEPTADAPVGDGVSGDAPVSTQVVLAPGITASQPADGVGSLTIEVWVDADGLVRKSVMPPELGGETITVIATSADVWVPMYPTAEQTQPLTAQALFHLGI